MVLSPLLLDGSLPPTLAVLINVGHELVLETGDGLDGDGVARAVVLVKAEVALVFLFHVLRKSVLFLWYRLVVFVHGLRLILDDLPQIKLWHMYLGLGRLRALTLLHAWSEWERSIPHVGGGALLA